MREFSEMLKRRFTGKVLLVLVLAGCLPPVFFIAKYSANYSELETGVQISFLYLIGQFAHSIFLTISAAFASISVVIFLQIKFPWEKGVAIRLLLEIIFTNLVVSAVMLLSVFSFRFFFQGHVHDDNSSLWFDVLATGVIMNVLLTSAYEGYYFFVNWKLSLVKAERLERENLQAQFSVLKSQINPHFLFNSLNVLSNLVYENAEKAELFIDEFARVYRYLLDVHDCASVSLEEEMEIVEAYLYLQSIRFGSGLNVHVAIKDDLKDYRLPPLAVQLCVENAIKHNIVSEYFVLSITISCSDKSVIVRNNLQRRGNVESTGLGQRNLLDRYKLYAGIAPFFRVEEGRYVAELPLIN